MRFRAIGPKWDEHTDARRWRAVERSIRNAIAEIVSEKRDLNQRAEVARVNASMLMGNDPFEYQDREAETERLLTEAEAELVSAERRICELSDQEQRLCRILEFLQPG